MGYFEINTRYSRSTVSTGSRLISRAGVLDPFKPRTPLKKLPVRQIPRGFCSQSFFYNFGNFANFLIHFLAEKRF